MLFFQLSGNDLSGTWLCVHGCHAGNSIREKRGWPGVFPKYYCCAQVWALLLKQEQQPRHLEKDPINPPLSSSIEHWNTNTYTYMAFNGPFDPQSSEHHCTLGSNNLLIHSVILMNSKITHTSWVYQIRELNRSFPWWSTFFESAWWEHKKSRKKTVSKYIANDSDYIQPPIKYCSILMCSCEEVKPDIVILLRINV